MSDMVIAICKLGLVIMASWAMSAWTIMMVVGAAHHTWFADMPTIGYAASLSLAGQVFLITLISAIILGVLRLALYGDNNSRGSR